MQTDGMIQQRRTELDVRKKLTTEHWIQRITFAAETNEADTHTVWQTDAQLTQVHVKNGTCECDNEDKTTVVIRCT